MFLMKLRLDSKGKTGEKLLIKNYFDLCPAILLETLYKGLILIVFFVKFLDKITTQLKTTDI